MNECSELNNIKYKTMLLSGKPLVEKKDHQNSSFEKIELYLQQEKEYNSTVSEPWTKLDRTMKNEKLQEFSVTYVEKNGLHEMYSPILVTFLRSCLDRKRLLSNKEINYCKVQQKIESIPNLHFKNSSFMIENEIRSTSIKSLTPIKKNTKKTNDIKLSNKLK